MQTARTNDKNGFPSDRWTTSKEIISRHHKLKNIELDLTDKAIAQKLVKDEDINHRLHHAGIALGAEELQLFVTMFTEFFQVIEEDKKKKKKPNYYYKYKALRDAISHRQLDPHNPKAAMAKVKQYYRPPNNFEFTSTNEFDYDSEKNLRQLKSQANNLKKRAMSYLKRKI